MKVGADRGGSPGRVVSWLARAAAQGATIAAGGFLFAVAVVALLDVEGACVDRRWLLFS